MRESPKKTSMSAERFLLQAVAGRQQPADHDAVPAARQGLSLDGPRTSWSRRPAGTDLESCSLDASLHKHTPHALQHRGNTCVPLESGGFDEAPCEIALAERLLRVSMHPIQQSQGMPAPRS